MLSNLGNALQKISSCVSESWGKLKKFTYNQSFYLAYKEFYVDALIQLKICDVSGGSDVGM